MNELQDPSDANAGGTSSSEVALTSAQDSKLKVFESSPDLQALCKDNGISARQFARKSDTVTVLEMFLGFWPSMKSVMHFPSLRELFIINHPTISAIEGLEVCANLEVLCITECSLSRITGVGQCAKLRHVNFSKNKLKNIENLDALNQLEILWVNENMLETLDGLRKLTKLSQLWACQNQIDSLDTALNSCTTLQELNLAGNRLNNFKGLLPLASLDCLTTLILSDPHFGDNPVCRLCNYQTYLLCHLSHLTHLDTIEVSARNRQTAETTMIKKKVYYNMRIRSIRRDACMQIKRYEAIRRHAEQQIDANIAALTRQKKEIESFLCDYFLQLNETAPRQNQVTIQLEKKVDCLNACLKEQCADIHRLYTEFDQLCVDFLHASDRNASRLLLELGTAGNIRLEDGKSSDAWYSSCIDLVRSRLSPADLKKFEVEDIKINRVTRVSNRFLRNRFHSKMEAIVGLPSLEAKANVSKKGVTVLSKDDKLTDASAAEPEHTDGMQLQLDEAPSRGQDPLPGSTLDVTVEYLFYLPSKLMEHSLRSSRDAELYYVAENGFRDPTEYGKTGHESAIKLSNSIALLDSAQLTADLDRRRQSNESVDSNAATPRVLMIVKVFPGYMKCIPESEAGVVARASTNSSLSPIRPDAFPGLSCLQVHSGAPFNEISPTGPKIYYMFDEALVLPEYIVEYQYVRQGDQDTVAPEATTASTNSSDGPTPITEVSESIDMMTPRQAGDLMSDIADVGLGLSSPLAEIFERKYRSQSTRISTDHSGTDEAVTRILHMGPSLPETSSMMTESPNGPRINAKLLALKAGNLHKLSLIGCKLEAIPDLASVVDLLEVLVLSYNSIQSIDNLIGLSKLRVLDLSYNRLAQLRQLEHLQALESLDISHNQLQIFSEVAYVGRSFAGQALRRLDLRNNPLCKTKRYRLHAIQCVSYLHQLDQQDITANEATIALQLVTKLSRARVWEVGTRSSSNQQKTRQLATSAPLDSAETWTSVEDIDLSHELISTIEGLDLATNLLVANFADNLVDSLNGLDACRRLDELCLDDNKLTRIEHLENLVLLKKLYLGRNSICAIEGLDTLENLVQLSLEDNQISSLRGLGSLLRLMELYLGNNRVETLKEMQHLKSLPRLTILDLVGNDIASLPDYRSYSVYYLRRLKVLDGITVTPQDQSNAKQKYSGKLTLEFAMEKCGVGNTLTPRSPSAGLDRIVELDLSSCRLREISVIARANFPNLRELNLENNQISDTAELDDLPSLRRLNLNRNRIERLVLMRHVPSSTESTPARTIVFARLECLYLAYNQISDIAMLGLHLLHELKAIHLQGNLIAQLTGLVFNSEIQDLRLGMNRIRQVDATVALNLRRLKVLSLDDNMLKSLASFENMTNLEALDLSNNRILELDEVDSLAPLQALADVRFLNNPVTKKHMYRTSVINKLVALANLDGREVTVDERERATILFAHERAAAAVSSSVANYAVAERVSPGLAMAPSSVPSRKSMLMHAPLAAMGAPTAGPDDISDGVPTRKLVVVPSPFSGRSTSQAVPIPDSQASNAQSHATAKNRMGSSPGAVLRNMAVMNNQTSNNNLGGSGLSSRVIGSPSTTVTVGSALNANVVPASYGAGLEHTQYGGQRSDRRRFTSVRYDHPSVSISPRDGNSLAGPTNISKPGGSLMKQGLSAYPSAVDQGVNPAAYSKPDPTASSAKGVGGGSMTPFSSYIVLNGNQKRYPGYLATQADASTIPYLSAKLQQQAPNHGQIR